MSNRSALFASDFGAERRTPNWRHFLPWLAYCAYRKPSVPIPVSSYVRCSTQATCKSAPSFQLIRGLSCACLSSFNLSVNQSARISAWVIYFYWFRDHLLFCWYTQRYYEGIFQYLLASHLFTFNEEGFLLGFLPPSCPFSPGNFYWFCESCATVRNVKPQICVDNNFK
jgi:hypothetical protein